MPEQKPDEFGFYTFKVEMTVKTEMPEIVQAMPETCMEIFNSPDLKVEKVNVTPA